MAEALTTSAMLVERLGTAGIPSDQVRQMLDRATRPAATLNRSPAEQDKVVGDLIEKVEVEENTITIRVPLSSLSGEAMVPPSSENPSVSPIRRLGLSRRELFEAIERPPLQSLPITEYVYAEWRLARVAGLRVAVPFYHSPSHANEGLDRLAEIVQRLRNGTVFASDGLVLHPYFQAVSNRQLRPLSACGAHRSRSNASTAADPTCPLAASREIRLRGLPRNPLLGK